MIADLLSSIPADSLSPLLAFSTKFWIKFWEILFGTVFSIALIWVVMQIWKKDEKDE